MRILLVGINARYIHTNNAVRLLAANSRFDVDFVEYTINDSLDLMVKDILRQNPDILGLSTYIWNVGMVTELIALLKEKTAMKIILGGPEVSYDAPYFLELTAADVIVRGEGEVVFDAIIESLSKGISLKNIPNVCGVENDIIFENPIQEIHTLHTLKRPYYFDQDYLEMPRRIAYIESSRGCPYHCSYCLSSLEERVRFFPIEQVKEDILHLMQKGVKRFKFLDRTFNANRHTKALLDFIIKHHLPDTVFQFEITADVLSADLVEHINHHAPKNLFRFEIGVQSVNPLTNRLVDRPQDNERLFKIITAIQSANIIDLHLDLIAGLPKEDLPSFKTTFNTVFALGAKELQLGFLKMLRGTKIRREAALHAYKYSAESPYEITANDCLTQADIRIIKAVETTLNIFHNKGHFDDFIGQAANQTNDPFGFFLNLYHFMEKSAIPFTRYQLHELYRVLDNYLLSIGFDHTHSDTLKRLYLKRAKVKPRCYFETIKDKRIRHYCFEAAAKISGLPTAVFYKHAIVTDTAEDYLIALYQQNSATLYTVRCNPEILES